ncbi:MAG: response regulator [Burkholderiaceae bacterium]|nr:response regulator [Burkholderiaceae bacterium]
MSAPRVLVVDDNLMNIELVKFVLGEDGFLVDTALDASEALVRIASFQPELILMDIQLPGMDGLELTRMLKADPALKHIVVLAFTAYAMRGDEARMRAAGCDGYLSKPIDVSTFAASVRASLAAG